ncbi:hypothetical protein [Flexivirga oryzae]|uniref:Peptidase M23 n=1 Tax=Flexivirga oryzae TaxID=1794944 RepID=A0A839NAI8_9MICO|nr:hypothetical protein [Flexivirga oryzae]MBB2892235.1 hypothetical protein [Flexivirga oryzae]
MRNLATGLVRAGLVVGIAAGGAALAAPATAASGPSYHGCPYGAVCVYPGGTGFNHDHPKYVWYSYAGHNIYNELGTNRIVNNQSANAGFGLCRYSNGTGGVVDVAPWPIENYSPSYEDFHAKLVNSVDLRPESQIGANTICHR